MAPINLRSYFLVTGGSGGIGSAICRLLVTNGIIPIVGYNSNILQAQNLAKETGGFALKINMININEHHSMFDLYAKIANY